MFEMDNHRVKYAANEKESLGLLLVAPDITGNSHLQTTAKQEQIIDKTQDLRENRRMVDFLAHRGNERGAKTDVAVKKLEQLEMERGYAVGCAAAELI